MRPLTEGSAHPVRHGPKPCLAEGRCEPSPDCDATIRMLFGNVRARGPPRWRGPSGESAAASAPNTRHASTMPQNLHRRPRPVPQHCDSTQPGIPVRDNGRGPAENTGLSAHGGCVQHDPGGRGHSDDSHDRHPRNGSAPCLDDALLRAPLPPSTSRERSTARLGPHPAGARSLRRLPRLTRKYWAAPYTSSLLPRSRARARCGLGAFAPGPAAHVLASR